jgi:diguanylate cyclase (GGDEF)-like protein
MSERAVPSEMADTEEELGLTTSIRKLSISAESLDDYNEDEIRGRSAVLICKDNRSRKWGTRWLRQSGFETRSPGDLRSIVDFVRSECPDVIVVDACIRLRGGVRIFEVLHDAPNLAVPIVVLCSNDKEVAAALAACVFEVVRKPFDWQLVGRRAEQAARASEAEEQTEKIRDAMRSALMIADNARRQLRSRESFEPVTGMPNSAKFDELLKRGVQAADRDGSTLAVFVIGLSRFRLVVEAMGQDNANIVLAEIGRRLSQSLLESSDVQTDTPGLRTAAAASLDAARFGMMLTCASRSDGLTAFLQNLIDKLSRPVQVAGQTVYVTACVGAALYPGDAKAVDSLLQRADNAMRYAQSRGGGFRFHCAETDAAAARKLKVEHMLHEAFEQNELTVEYQPVVDVDDQRVVGAEALLRWHQPDRSQISPAEFVPIAEESGLIIALGEFVLDEACRLLQRWQGAGESSLHVCVNVARSQLMSGGFVRTVQDILGKYDFDAKCLDLELSERGVLSGNYDVVNQLHALKELGVRLSIDDFGAGNSAISYLKDLPIDVMKIDRSYISNLTNKGKEAALTSAMITLGHRLGLSVVAEGVETAEQLQRLQSLGCDRFQGYYVSPAVPYQDLDMMIRSRRSI